MLIVVTGLAEVRGRFVRYLLDEHQFTACSRLPRGQINGRMVATVDPPATRRARLTLARRTAKLGGILVSLADVPAAEVTLPVKFEAAADHLVWQFNIGAWGGR